MPCLISSSSCSSSCSAPSSPAWSRVRRGHGAAALAALLLAGCAGEVERPLGPQTILAPPTAVEDARMAVVVTPFEGLDRPEAAALQDALVKALRARDVAASAVNPAPGSHLVRGRAVPDPSGLVAIEGEMVSPGGLVDARMRALGRRLDDEGSRVALARELANDLVDGPRAPRLAMPTPAAPSYWRVRVPAIDAAPGDGGQTLPRAVRRALALSGVPVVEESGPDVLTLEGRVDLLPPRGSAQGITIGWRVLGPDGAEMGRVDQSNEVPTGSLDGAWGPVASAAGSAAAEGLATAIGRLPPPSAATPGQSGAK